MKKLLAGMTAAAVLMGSASYAETTLKLVEVITSPERTEVLQGIVDEFEANNPDVAVEIVSLPWGSAFEKLATMVAGGDIPDVVEMPDTWQALYAGSDQLVSLKDHVAGWDQGATLTDKTVAMGSQAGDLYMIPYGFYLRAMFYNKKLLAEAGIDTPPTTMEEFKAASAAVSELDGKYGYCLRGGPGGTNGWIMFAAAMNGTNEFFTEDGISRINEPGSVEGIQFMIDMYQNGYAPKDSVSWGFNEIVAGFYSGTCAFLDQDPDALIAIAERMPAEDFAVIPMPVGPSGKAFPTIGFAGWSIFNATEHEEEAFDLVAALSSPEANATWAKRVGVIPIHKGADQDPHFQTEQFKGWFEELNGEQYVPTTMPTNLEQWGYFGSTLLLESSQEALLGQRSAQDVADEWAEFLTDEHAKWKANQ
ncbi:ABC transporter substrate-binding protein [Ruegeria hyattellae]|uniref:ABC transporter substrate-binding protein n=1 Tax=Ruegeria hyattellae TaxID=3233337 RepID=UPI00355B3AE8